MGNEVKENQEAKKATATVSMSLNDIPASVHKKILQYRNAITGQRNRTFSVKEAYVEFLKQHTK
jgi:hypothetical protein